MKKMDEKKLKEDSGFPYGWNKGDTCVMITNKTKKSTCEYTVESYDGSTKSYWTLSSSFTVENVSYKGGGG